MKDIKNTILWGGIILLGIFTFYPLLKVGIVTGDDLGYMLWPLDHFGSDAKAYAEGTGRFYFLITLWVYKIPYLIDSQIFFYTMLILPIITSFGLFVWLMKRVFQNVLVAILSALIACSIFQISGGHSATAAYPFYFSFSFSLLLCSFHFLLSYIREGKYQFLIIASVILAITTLFYESYLVFYILVFIFIISQYRLQEILSRKVLKKITKELFPFIFWGAAYLVVYYLYYRSCPAQYGGNTFSAEFEFAIFAKAMGNMAFYALPLSSLFDYQFFLTEYAMEVRQTENLICLIFAQASITAYIKAIISVVVLVYLMNYLNFKFKKSYLVSIGIIALIFIFLPHLPLALSEKYSTSIQNAYVTTYFAFFAVVVFLVIFLLMIENRLLQFPIVKKSVVIIFGILLFFATLSTQFINERVVEDLAVAQKRLEIMEKMLVKEYIDDGAHIYVEPLHYSTSYFSKSITRQGSPFASFAKEKNGVEMFQYLNYNEFYQKFKDQSGKVYLIYFAQAPKTGDCQMLIVPLIGNQLREQFLENRSDSMIVGYLSIYKKMSVSVATDSTNTLFAAGRATVSVGNLHYTNLTFHLKPDVSIFTIKGIGIKPSTLMISNMLYKDAPLVRVGNYPKNYEARWVKHIMHNLQKNQEFIHSIEQKAQEQGISYKQALRNDAKWLLYNEFQ